jgi:hypothetical protein
MECVEKQQTIHYAEISAPSEIRIRRALWQAEFYDKEAAKFRRHIASEAALRQLESRKNLGTITAHRLSFNR